MTEIEPLIEVAIRELENYRAANQGKDPPEGAGFLIHPWAFIVLGANTPVQANFAFSLDNAEWTLLGLPVGRSQSVDRGKVQLVMDLQGALELA